MNTEDFVTFSQASRLKKLGFDLETDYVYISIDSTQSIVTRHEFTGAALDRMCDTSVPAPTLWEAQKWLLRERGYYVYVDPSSSAHNKFYWNITKHNDTKKDFRWAFTDYNSPEEALSEGITECLRILKNEGNSKIH